MKQLLEQRPNRYLRAPYLYLADGALFLQVTSWEPEGEHLLRFSVSDDLEIQEVDSGPYIEGGIIALESDTPPHPTSDCSAELRAFHDGYRVIIEYDDDTSSVFLETPEKRILVFYAAGMVAAPAIKRVEQGTWIAFHHNIREDTKKPDIAKWIAVRFVDNQGIVLEPKSPMLDRDRDLSGVEQSFEFPSIAVGQDGAISIFGRGSHNMFRQDLSADGFSHRQPLSDGEWGSRGRRITSCVKGSDIFIAWRDKKGILLLREQAPVGGFPIVQPAEVFFQSSSSAKHIRIETKKDPARAHDLFTYFGDIQQHSAHSDGVGSADEVYFRARYHYDDDFVALTDHESFLGKRTGPGEWRYLQEVANRYNDPGSFATLFAYEWTGTRHPGPGHKCVFFPQDNLPLISRDDFPQGKDAVKKIQQLGGFSSPHHIGWTGCDEDGHDPIGQPVWEICSCHGCYEYADHPIGQRGDLKDQCIDVMLKKGHRFGFTASSDSHGLLWHHGESRKRDPYRTGLTAVHAPELTREAVFHALKNRRCYATSGEKIWLDVTVNGAPMGSEINETEQLDVMVHTQTLTPLKLIEIVGHEGTLQKYHVSGYESRHETKVKSLYIYARVTLENDEMAWSSPVFINGIE